MKKLFLVLSLMLLSLLATAQTEAGEQLVLVSDAYKILKLDPVSMIFVRVDDIVYDTTTIAVTREDGITVSKQNFGPNDRDFGIEDLSTVYTYARKPYIDPLHPEEIFCKLLPPTGVVSMMTCVIVIINTIPDIRFAFEMDGDLYIVTYRLVKINGKDVK